MIKDIKKHLLNTKIVDVKYMTKKETNDYGWYKTPIVIKLSNGVVLVPIQDDEGNDGGAIATNIEGLSTIPTDY
tara:strand:+ start:1206 stop:1427 length:222 start_codon:yes stop_codon:yes gene_type:complete